MTETVIARTATGAYRIAGTRVSLDSVVHAYWNGQQPDAIVAEYPALTHEQVAGAIEFYLAHRAEIDAYLLTQDERWRELQLQVALRMRRH